ncbi:MAG: response regulator [Kofleriaceae bacterium]|nr:response regulator [Kofleriaceae bacterium]
MLSAVLHVEDDPALTSLVERQFEKLGFQGTTVVADTVEAAQRVLDERSNAGEPLDLIISDMNLPDGSGLDVVRRVRASPTWAHTPVLILSGDLDPKKVGRAYALGANAYVDKAPPGRALGDVVRALYDHWGRDVVPPGGASPFEQTLVRASVIRARHAAVYQRLAERFSDNRSESAFWLGRAVNESNVINLIAFLRRHGSQRELSDDLQDEIQRMQERTEAQLDRVEKVVGDPSLTRDQAYRLVVDLLACVNATLLARAISHMFPVAPVAMMALRDFFVGGIADVTAWIDLHTLDTVVRARTAELRIGANHLAEATGALPG